MSQKITPFLWFDNQAEEAINFYTSAIPNSRIESINRYPDGMEGPMSGMSGKVITGVFELAGTRFMALDGGPMFKFTPAISFFVNLATAAEVDALWAKLSDGATVLMELDAYPFSEKFGWLMDKYGLTWQVNLDATSASIVPYLLFVGDQLGKAEPAMRLYTSLFNNSGIDLIQRHEDSPFGDDGLVMQGMFHLAGQTFRAMDSGAGHQFTFNEAISFYVECESQQEVDRYWDALSAVPDSEQCGWLKDRFGVSWQIIPTALPRLMSDPDPEKSQRVMQAMLQMKKIDVAGLEKAYEG